LILVIKRFFKISLIVFLLIQFVFSQGQEYNSKTTLPGAGSKINDKKIGKDSPGDQWTGDVIIVYKTHFDLGYSERVREVIHDYRTSMADCVLEAIEENRNQPPEKQFVWTLSGWPMTQIIWEGQEPSRKEQIEQAIIDGNLSVHAFPFTLHTESCALEDIVRGLNISSSLARKFGKPLSKSAKTTDVPGHSWIIPTLFVNAGIQFYHFGGSVVNKDLGLPMFFWWEGPDGSRLLTLYNNNYGSDPLPPEGWPYKTWIYLNMTGDNQGPPDPETVARDLEYYKSRGISARVGSMDDFTDMILEEDLSSLPVVRSDIGDTWIHGTMSMPESSILAQHVRPAIGALDQLTTIERIWGIFRPEISDIINKAYEQSLLYSEHTWGLANQHYIKVPYGEEWQEMWKNGLPPQYMRMKASWDDHAGYIKNVERLISEPYYDAVATLADHVGEKQNRIVVYNPLPWERDGEIAFDTRLIFGNDFVSLKPVDGGPFITVEHEFPAIEDKAPFARFVVKDIPPMGYRTFVASKEQAPANAFLFADRESGIIESPFFKVVIDPQKGGIVSMIDKRTGRELVDAGAPYVFGQYLYERFGYGQVSRWIDQSLFPQYKAHRVIFASYDMPQDVPYSCAIPQNITLNVKESAIDVKAILSGSVPDPGHPQQVTVSITLSGYLPIAELEIVWEKQPDTWPEAGWICLPFKCENPAFRLGRLGAVVDPVEDMVVENANYHMWWVNNGVAVYNSRTGGGVGVSSPDAPLVSLGEPGEYKFSQRRKPEKPYIFFNLYNNHWRTNFPAWIGDGQQMRARVRLWSFDNYDTEKSLFTPAMENRLPLDVAASKVQYGKLPPCRRGIVLSRKGIAITAFGPNPDGEGIILRCWEQAGKEGRLTVTLPEGSKYRFARPVDLRGRDAGKLIGISEDKFDLYLKAYTPVSFVLTR
jgi:alpha-mannosidase